MLIMDIWEKALIFLFTLYSFIAIMLICLLIFGKLRILLDRASLFLLIFYFAAVIVFSIVASEMYNQYENIINLWWYSGFQHSKYRNHRYRYNEAYNEAHFF